MWHVCVDCRLNRVRFSSTAEINHHDELHRRNVSRRRKRIKKTSDDTKITAEHSDEDACFSHDSGEIGSSFSSMVDGDETESGSLPQQRLVSQESMAYLKSDPSREYFYWQFYGLGLPVFDGYELLS